MCVEDNKTKTLIDSLRPFVAGRSFLQPVASSSLLANTEAERVNFCLSSKLELPHIDLGLKKSFGYSSPSSEAWQSSNQQSGKNYWEGLQESPAPSEPVDKRIVLAASDPIRGSRHVERQT